MTQADQTFVSFKDKWEQNKKLAFEGTSSVGTDIFNWILTRNGFKDADALKAYLADKHRILDAGCGNGRVTALLHKYASETAEIFGVDLTAADVARENLVNHSRVKISQGDLLGDLSKLGKFDYIYCQEVLHHTSNPKKAFLNVASLLDKGGEYAIYVYKIKAPIREYADDLVRDRISNMPYEEAMKAMSQITELGKILTNTNLKVTVPDVDVLGIQAGEYDIQRFLYHFFLKCFWSAELSYDENVAINYDWYHPQLCTRHTMEEVLDWFKEAGLTVVHQFQDHYGITVRGRSNT